MKNEVNILLDIFNAADGLPLKEKSRAVNMHYCLVANVAQSANDIADCANYYARNKLLFLPSFSSKYISSGLSDNAFSLTVINSLQFFIDSRSVVGTQYIDERMFAFRASPDVIDSIKVKFPSKRFTFLSDENGVLFDKKMANIQRIISGNELEMQHLDS